MHRKQGFTLIEVMVSVVILAVGIVLIIESLHGAFGAVQAARDTTRLTLLARQLLQDTEEEQQTGRLSAGVTSGRPDVPENEYWWQRRIAVESPRLSGHFDAMQAGSLLRVEIELGRREGDVEHRLVSYIWRAPDEERPHAE